MDVPSEVSTIVLSNTDHVDIGWLSLVNRSAADHDAVWNNKLHKLGYPSLPCPQGFYYLLTTSSNYESLLVSLINSGITAWVKAFLTVNKNAMLDVNIASELKCVRSLTPEIGDCLRPYLARTVTDIHLHLSVVTNALSSNCLALIDLVIEVIEPDTRQSYIHHITVAAKHIVNALPIFAKYQLYISTGPTMYMAYSNEDYVRVVLALPWMGVRHFFSEIPYCEYEPFLADFEAAYAKDPVAYQPVMDIINRAREEVVDHTFDTPSTAWDVSHLP